MEIRDYVISSAESAKRASRILAGMDTEKKDHAILSMADAIEKESAEILEANRKDLKAAEDSGTSKAMLDRLMLNEARVYDMARGLREIAELKDPIGEMVSAWKGAQGIEIGQIRVPLGVIGIVYEARPNVTTDAAGLCLKAGSAVVLRGGSEAINTNRVVVRVIKGALRKAGLPDNAVELIEVTDREAVNVMLKLNNYIDVIIPRGGAGLIRTVVENATVPVIETGVGNCHVYIDSEADYRMAIDIIINAKTQRPAVCNAIETVLINSSIANEFLPQLARELFEHGVEIRGCERTLEILPNVKEATEEDYKTEFLDLILAVKIVDDIDRAMEHIDMYGTGHSEAIITNDYAKARKFLRGVDAAAVYVNASTRFTDGHQFGFGAEIGISTQKIHARGPMGLKELTTTKYVIYGEGQIRK